MRTADQIIRAALGDPDFDIPHSAKRSREGHFEVVELELPSRPFFGVPPVWRFSILTSSGRSPSAREKEEIIAKARELVETYPMKEEEPPLVLISDEPGLNLGQQLPQTHPNVFFLDAKEIPGLKRPINRAPFVPIIMAVRKRLSRYETALRLSPYRPGEPARSWRFFGRKKELSKLANGGDNVIIVGPRQIGKTSLLLELQKRLQSHGYKVYFIDVQDLSDERLLRKRILESISLRDFEAISRRGRFSDEDLLYAFLRRMSARERIVLLVDELGNVVSKMKGEDWKTLGVLRQFAHSGRVRIIATSFQQFRLKEAEDFSGPWVNFASAMPLGGMTRQDIEEFVVAPISTWVEVGDPRGLVELVYTRIGTHPLLLQHFARALFTEVVEGRTGDVLGVSKGILEDKMKMVTVFDEVIQSMFFRMSSSLLRFAFLAGCLAGVEKGQAVRQCRIEQKWLDGELRLLGFRSTISARRAVLEQLELRGLTEPVEGDHGVQRVVAPLVFEYLCRVESDVRGLVAEYKSEIDLEASRWDLRVIGPEGRVAVAEG